jgi:hypothetical protein
MASMAPSVVRLADGVVGLRLNARERTILRALLDDLRSIVGEETVPPGLSDADDDDEQAPYGPAGGSAPGPDPVRARLYPDARRDDPEWSARFRDLVRGGLDDARRANIAVVEATLDARTIDDRQAEAWLHVLNDLRLVMGTRLGVTDDDQAEPFDAEDPDAAARLVYAYAGWVEEQFVDVLASALPDVPDAPDADHP